MARGEVRFMLAECSKSGQPLFENIEYCPQGHRKNPNSKVGAFGFVPWPSVALGTETEHESSNR